MKKIITIITCILFITACTQKEQNTFTNDFNLENQIIEEINIDNLSAVSNDTGIIFIGTKDNVEEAKIFLYSLEKKSINKAYYLKVDDSNNEKILETFEITKSPIIVAYQNGKKMSTISEITKDNLTTLIDEIYPQTCTDRC